MSTVGIVSIVLGIFVMLSRGILLVAPASTLRWVKTMIGSESRTRVMGGFALLVGGSMVWAGVSDDSVLAGVLFVLGVFVLMVAVPMLLLFPRIYMSFCDELLPSDSSENLFGWRLLGLLGVILGMALFHFGLASL